MENQEDSDKVMPLPEDDEVVEELAEELGSSLTLERAAAAKKFIENHYKAQMKHIQERKQRYSHHKSLFIIRWLVSSVINSLGSDKTCIIDVLTSVPVFLLVRKEMVSLTCPWLDCMLKI